MDPRALRDLAVIRYNALSEMSGQLSFSVALLGQGCPPRTRPPPPR